MMGVLNGVKAVVAFLTIFPAKTREPDSLETVAQYMPLFPFVGFAIGVVSGLAGLAFATLLPHVVAGLLTLGVILLITGVHHTDGLLDFGDGLMRRGTREEKLEAMRDTMTGAGGFALGAIVLLATAFSISYLRTISIPLAIGSAETAAKSSMVLAAGIGKSAGQGMNTPFIEAMHGKQRGIRTVIPSLFTFSVGYISSGPAGLAGAAGSFLASWAIVWISERHFGGLTGDVFGAINDIGRMVALLALVAGVR